MSLTQIQVSYYKVNFNDNWNCLTNQGPNQLVHVIVILNKTKCLEAQVPM